MDEIEMTASARWDHVASLYDTYVQATFDVPFFLQEATKISQFYEQYNIRGVLQEKRLLQINFALLQREEFETLAKSAGFKILALYGDYSYAPFDDETSPYMIWILGK